MSNEDEPNFNSAVILAGWDGGFVLVSVNWIAGLLAVIATAFTISIRGDILAGGNEVYNVQVLEIAARGFDHGKIVIAPRCRVRVIAKLYAVRPPVQREPAGVELKRHAGGIDSWHEGTIVVSGERGAVEECVGPRKIVDEGWIVEIRHRS